VGETRRQGIELSLNGSLADNRLDWFLSYTRLKATFEDNLTIASPNNPFATDVNSLCSPVTVYPDCRRTCSRPA
ncbi:MAG: hypothetical protein ACH253_07625, partial [Candidatus Thiodiazotropha sp.]